MAEQILAIGNKIELNRRRNTNSIVAADKTTYVSQILDIEGDLIIAAMPIYEGHLVALEAGSALETYFYTAKGIYKADCSIVSRGKEGNVYMMKLALTTELKKFQRRQYYRLPCSIEAIVQPLQITEVMYYSKYHELLLDTRAIIDSGMIVDISGGGIRMMTERRYAKDDYLLLRFPIEMHIGVEQMNLMGRIVASLESSNRKNYYDNRIQFKEIPAEQRDLLVKYIFEQQRKIQQRERR